jgi:hypothetical protein
MVSTDIPLYVAKADELQFNELSSTPKDLVYDPISNDVAPGLEHKISTEADLLEDELRYPISGLRVKGYLEPWEEAGISEFRPAELELDIPRARALFRLAGNAALAQVKAIIHRRTWAAMAERRKDRLEYIDLAYKYYAYCDMMTMENGAWKVSRIDALTDAESRRQTELS